MVLSQVRNALLAQFAVSENNTWVLHELKALQQTRGEGAGEPKGKGKQFLAFYIQIL